MSEVINLLLEGRELTTTRAIALERQLARDPLDLSSRIRLLAFYGKRAAHAAAHRKRFRQQNLWFIAHAPESAVCSIPIFDLPPASNRAFYRRARRQWLAHCRRSGVAIGVLANAARFFEGLNEYRVAEKLLCRIEALEPAQPEWKTRLGNLHARAALRGTRSQRTAKSRTALAKFEQAHKLMLDARVRFYELPTLARTAFAARDLRKATKYARAALAQSEVFRDWARGNGIHHGHLVLGRVAFARGNLALAARHLLDAGRTPGSCQLNSFGPSFELAEELLAAGDQQSVLDYLELCRSFWSYRAKALDAWQAQIRAGKRPDFQNAHTYTELLATD